MRFYTSLITAALLTSLFIGCSKHSPTATTAKITDLGVVEVANGIQSHHYLGGGRICFISPTVFTNGLVELGISVQDTNSGTVVLTVRVETILERYVEVGNKDAGIGLIPQTKP
jgi:hypothetical protein